MDVSKLPRLSKTESPPQMPSSDLPPPPPPPISHSVAEAWISIGVGVFLVLYCPNTLLYVCSKLFHTHFGIFGPYDGMPGKVDYILYVDGSKTFYRDMTLFWSDLVISVFALALMVDGILMVCFRRLPIILLALCLTLAATLGNLVYLVTTYSQGLAVISALAVLFGGYIAFGQWNMAAQMLRARQRGR